MTALTHITAPSKKLILTTLGLVVGAHLLTGGVLSNMAPTPLPKQILPESKPIEIEMITLAPIEEKEPEPEIIRQKETEPEMRRASARKVVKKPPTSTKQAPKPKTQTEQQSTAKKYQPPTKVNETQRATTTNAPTSQPTTTINNTQTIIAKGSNSSYTEPMPATGKGTTAATSTAESQAQRIERERKEREAEEEREKQQAIQDKKDRLAAEAIAQAKKDAEAADREKAARDAAANQGPVNFSYSEARWINEPYFSNIENNTGKTVSGTISFQVSKQGKISNLSINGINNRNIERAIRNVMRGAKLKPFTQNGAPVVGKVNLPITFKPIP